MPPSSKSVDDEFLDVYRNALDGDTSELAIWATGVANFAQGHRPPPDPEGKYAVMIPVEAVGTNLPFGTSQGVGRHVPFTRDNFLVDLQLVFSHPGLPTLTSMHYPLKPESKKDRLARHVLVELRKAICGTDARYSKEIADLSKNGRALVAGITTYVAASVGVAPAIVAAIAAASIVLAMKIGVRSFCSFMQDEELVYRERLKAMKQAGIPLSDDSAPVPAALPKLKPTTRRSSNKPSDGTGS